jgi:HNH endonuclease
MGKLLDTFEELVLIETDDCVVWPHGTDKGGYGVVRFDGFTRPVHRVALERHVGPPPTPEHKAAHGPCHNRRCMNYRHLSWKTNAENLADKLRDGTLTSAGWNRSKVS